MVLNSLDAIVQAAKTQTSGVMAVAAAHDTAVIEAVTAARRAGIVIPVLVGHTDEITKMLSDVGENPADYEIIPAESDVDCAKTAVRLVTEGKAHFLMKGIVGTPDLMRAVLAKEANLRGENLLSHIMMFESPGYHKMILMTDGAMNTSPDLEKKVQILDNAAWVLHKLGYETQRIGSSGIVALAGKKEGKCFLLRADMDALPVQERGQNPGRRR